MLQGGSWGWSFLSCAACPCKPQTPPSHDSVGDWSRWPSSFCPSAPAKRQQTTKHCEGLNYIEPHWMLFYNRQVLSFEQHGSTKHLRSGWRLRERRELVESPDLAASPCHTTALIVRFRSYHSCKMPLASSTSCIATHSASGFVWPKARNLTQIIKDLQGQAVTGQQLCRSDASFHNINGHSHRSSSQSTNLRHLFAMRTLQIMGSFEPTYGFSYVLLMMFSGHVLQAILRPQNWTFWGVSAFSAFQQLCHQCLGRWRTCTASKKDRP